VKIVNGKETFVGVAEKDLQKLNDDLEAFQKTLGDLQERIANMIKDGEGKSAKSVGAEEAFDAHFDEKADGFLCNYCGTKTVYGAPQIATHLLVKHKINPDDQHIDGWNDKYEKEYRASLKVAQNGNGKKTNGK